MFSKSIALGALALFASHALAVSPPLSMIPHENLGDVPPGWTAAKAPAPNTPITLQVALTMQNLDEMERQLYAVSTPGNPSYGKHLSKDEVNSLVAPSAASEQAVVGWLKKAGMRNITSDGSMVSFVTTVGAADKLLDTNFLYYEQQGVQKIRTTHYSIPKALAADIDFVTPTVYFGKVHEARTYITASAVEKREPASGVHAAKPCQTSITPNCLKELYRVTYSPTGDWNSKIGFGSFLNQSARHKDLKLYESFFGIPSQDFSDVFINTAENDQHPNPNVGEADLDVQNIVGVAHPLPVTQFLTGGSPPFHPDPTEPTQNENEPYLPYYQFLLRQENSDLPQVISNSYGEDEQTVPQKYAMRVCNLIGMMGMRGITIFESSGDEGVGAGCIATDGSKKPEFNPIFPATCPYLTSVGGLQSIAPEIAWIGSSGGFSYYWPRPAYQDAAVTNYLDNYIKPSTLAYYQPYFNQNGRGFPDVSAHSVAPNYQVYYNNKLAGSGGTSAASPVWAAIAAIINENLLSNGKSQLGFLNPFLYSQGYKGLHDVTLGGSIGCNGNNTQTGQPVPGAPIIPFASWNATVGWDPVTGLGLPHYAKLAPIALAAAS